MNQRPHDRYAPIERQPYTTFSAIAIPAGGLSTLRLSGGLTTPYRYQLAVGTTTPYVQLMGAAGGQKMISWNEAIEVPAGEMVTVRNASYHTGDIVINSGYDPAAIPSRITVPVPLQDIIVGETVAGVRGAFPVDTRRARRGFVANLPPTVLATTLNVYGEARERSHGINPSYAYPVLPTPTFLNPQIIPPATQPGLVPLGAGARPGDDVHAMLDVGRFEWMAVPGQYTESGAVLYVLEY